MKRFIRTEKIKEGKGWNMKKMYLVKLYEGGVTTSIDDIFTFRILVLLDGQHLVILVRKVKLTQIKKQIVSMSMKQSGTI